MTELRCDMNWAKFLNYNVLYKKYSRLLKVRVRKYKTEENVLELKIWRQWKYKYKSF